MLETVKKVPLLWSTYQGAAQVKQTLTRLAPKNIVAALSATLRRDTLVAYYSSTIPNWGDFLNPVLIELLSGKRVVRRDTIMLPKSIPVYQVIGSTLGKSRDENLVVWGAGFISSDARIATLPRAIHAVRGPLSRHKLLAEGISCPDVYGDPALLLPRFYQPPFKKKYALGIVPHYMDRGNPWLDRYRNDPDVNVIDVLGSTYEFIDEVAACDRIASSSLHGIIAADSYGIPAIWVEFSDLVVGAGFKFDDYHASVGRGTQTPFRIGEDVTLSTLIRSVQEYELTIDLELLHSTCPFAR